MAEFREIRHVGKALKRSLNRKQGFNKTEIPTKYRLNAGHVKFFYDKGLFLENRFKHLREELLRRGFDINLETRFNIDDFPTEYRNNYIPTVDEQKINIERIQLRISEKPKFYKKTSYDR